MQSAETREFGVLQARNGAEHAHLLAVFELGLEADHVEQGAKLVVLTQLDHGVRLFTRTVRIGEAERLHRPMPQCFGAALGHDLDRQAAVEIGRRTFPLMEAGLVGGEQGRDERFILFA